MKRCTRCVLPVGFPGIRFDRAGICNFCHAYDRERSRIDYAARERLLRRIFEHHRNRRGRYDCVFGWSGGKDSTYALYLLQERFGLRVLPFHYDNGFDRPESRANLERIADRLDVPLITIKHRPSDVRSAYARCVKAEGDFCIACVHPMLNSFARLARAEGARLLISAYSPDEGFPHGTVEHMMSNRRIKALLRDELSTDALSLFTLPSRLDRLKHRLRWIMLPRYLRWLDDEMFATLDRLGWKDSASRIRESDCAVFPLAEHIFVHGRGWGSSTVVRSNYIRAGRLPRAEAIAAEDAELSAGEPVELGALLDQLGLTRADLERQRR